MKHSDEQIVNKFFHKSFQIPAFQHAARFVGTYKFHLSLNVMKCFEFIELVVLLSSAELIFTGLSINNKTHTHYRVRHR
jgi:hypothetical protein